MTFQEDEQKLHEVSDRLDKYVVIAGKSSKEM